jgi:CRP-like cAMP-binding protein
MIKNEHSVHNIKRIPFLQSLSLEDLEDISSSSHLRNCSKGRDLFSMGQKATHFFSIQEGWIKLYRTSNNGEEVIINIFGPGESFAEAAVFSDHQTYPVHAQAIENTILIEIPRSIFIHKIEEDSRFAINILGAIAARQHLLVQQLEHLMIRSAPQRVGAFLLRFCQRIKGSESGWVVSLPYEKSIISLRLNIKPETFSRAVSKLSECGVYIESGRIIISDLNKLANYCDLTDKDIPC